jgi:putative colanic acid biosynthesis acetyltransferase WcaF
MSNSYYNPVQTNQLPKSVKIKAKLWSVINSSLFRYSPFFCRGLRRWSVILFGGDVHSTASLNRKATIDYPWNLTIGEKSSIGANSWVYAIDKIIIGEKSCIGDYVKLLTGSHEIESNDFKLTTKPIIIGDCCWISTAATVLPGVKIENGAVVATCAVVTKDIENFAVVAGNPAQYIKRREIKNL